MLKRADGIATFLEKFILAPFSFSESYVCDTSALWVTNGGRKLKMEPIPQTNEVLHMGEHSN